MKTGFTGLSVFGVEKMQPLHQRTSDDALVDEVERKLLGEVVGRTINGKFILSGLSMGSSVRTELCGACVGTNGSWIDARIVLDVDRALSAPEKVGFDQFLRNVDFTSIETRIWENIHGTPEGLKPENYARHYATRRSSGKTLSTPELARQAQQRGLKPMMITHDEVIYDELNSNDLHESVKKALE